MPDKILSRLAHLSGRTHVWLFQVAEVLKEAGLEDWAQAARVLAREHAETALECHEDTMPTMVRAKLGIVRE